ncbi:MAG TPA: 16S rRNA (cytosine(967)-C(5))-methyltransferase RsmB [bacterium]|nr:16S rRNA (cytosine(967)-C(5))-methyltransferase RsmB [bacterium]
MDAPRTSREVALEVLHRVDDDGAWSGVLLRRALERAGLSAVEEALATELTLGTLRHRAEVDWTLARFTRTPLGALPARIRGVLRMGAYQLLFVPRIPPHAACSESVELAKRVGHVGTARLVNAVLRRVAASPERPRDGATVEAIALRRSHPAWLVSRWVARFGIEETRALCDANNATPPSTIRLNTLRGAPDLIAARLADRGVCTEPSVWLPEGRRIVVAGDRDAAAPRGDGPGHADRRARASARQAAYDEGWFSPQDEASMLVARLLAPSPEETVIDACAAPGGKTTHLAALMENRGRIIACDVHAAKLDAVSRQCARLGVTIVETCQLDAARLGETHAGDAHRVLVDAPCSGLGVLRRRPEIKWRLQPDDLRTRAAEQRRILDGASAAVRPGGVLVYSVCTTEPEEGVDVVEAFLAAHAEFAPASTAGWPPGPGGVAAPLGAAGPAAAIERETPGSALLLPHRTGTDGFFVAVLRRAT